jgi:hypothetical protein
MAKEAKTVIWLVKMGDINYAWRADEDAYKGIAAELGVKQAKDTDNNVVFGSKNKPPRVRVNCADKKSYLRFCDPSKLESLIVKNTLGSKKLLGSKINSVRAVQG